MNQKSAFALISAISVPLMSACSGQMYFAKQDNISACSEDKPCKGVPFRNVIYVLELSETTQLVDKDGKLIGSASGLGASGQNELIKCLPSPMQKVVSMPDHRNIYRIWYEPGVFEGSNFNVKLQNGGLTEVNATGSPDKGETLANAAGALSTLAGAVVSLAGGEKSLTGNEVGNGSKTVLCNSGVVVRSVSPLP